MKKISVFIFMAADNNLDEIAIKDLEQFCSIGSTDQVNIIVEVDRNSLNESTKRYFVEYNKLQKLEDLGETSSGDYRTLRDFLMWGIQNYPAERYFVILWGHGTGVSDDNRYAEKPSLFENFFSVLNNNPFQDVLFIKNIKSNYINFINLLKKANKEVIIDFYNKYSIPISSVKDKNDFIKYFNTFLYPNEKNDNRISLSKYVSVLPDDSSEEQITIEDLEKAFFLNQRLDLIGFDACLMAMFEIYYQLKNITYCCVGSQDNEPATGWPYDMILKWIIDNPDELTENASVSIVNAYKDFYKKQSKNFTQSAFYLEGIEEIVTLINEFLILLINFYQQLNQNNKRKLKKEIERVQRFSDEDYIDLVHFIEICENAVDCDDITQKARIVKQKLNAIIIANEFNGRKLKKSYGISILFPKKESKIKKQVIDAYKNLRFNKDCPNWIRWIEIFNNSNF